MSSLRDDALDAFRAGVEAVQPAHLVTGLDRGGVSFRGNTGQSQRLVFETEPQRIIVVGGGKAGAGMLRALLDGTPPELQDRLRGWINVPADCVDAAGSVPVGITVHAAREAGVNEPRPEGATGTRAMLDLLRDAGPNDAAIVLLSGGGSALLPAPRGITLDQKLAVTKLLARRGAPIDAMNRVRRQLSEVKGGGLVRAFAGREMVVLAISDVIGDDWATIASGPTTPDADPVAAAALATETLRQYATGDDLPAVVWEMVAKPKTASAGGAGTSPTVHHRILGSNGVAAQAASRLLVSRGYSVESRETGRAGEANELGREFVGTLRTWRDVGREKVALISGGEPTVRFPVDPGRGGRNQQLVLSALASSPRPSDWERIALLSGGTDGEDGPTDAAGGLIDERVATQAAERGLDIADAHHRSAAYDLLVAAGGLIRTGPTQTNVMDLRIGLVR